MASPTQPRRLDWIGPIPSHWSVVPIRFVARLESGHTPSRSKPDYWVPEECTIPWVSLADVWQLRDGTKDYIENTAERVSDKGLANSSARLLPRGTVIVSRTASVGFSGILAAPMATTQDFVNWVCGPRVRPEYLLYVFRGMIQEFKRLTMGSTHQTIYMPDVRAFRMPLPPLAEQDVIVSRLRATLVDVDDLIRKKERLIELLQEKRQALITHAVTKGLDANAPMRDSGLPWLGEIPKHWEVKKLRWLLREPPRNGVSPPTASSGGTPTFSIAAVRSGSIRIKQNLKFAEISASEAMPFLVHRGDLLVMRGNGSLDLVGSAGIVDEEPPNGCIYPDILIRLRLTKVIHVRYLVAALNSRPLRAQVETAVRTAAGIWKISGGSLAGFRLPVPPPSEQERIVAFTSDVSKRAESSMALVARQLECLREYRQALISAAVTGQIDVTEEAAG